MREGDGVRQLGFSFDLSRCSGCMACVVACMDQNHLPGGGVPFRHVVQLEKGHYPSARISFVSLSCQNCSDAPCMVACPTKAIFRHPATGVVDVETDLCIGCHTCAMVCPFGAPHFSEEGKMIKCHLCIERVEQGLEPACVHTCTTRALDFGPMEELAKRKAKKASVKILESFSTASAGG